MPVADGGGTASPAGGAARVDADGRPSDALPSGIPGAAGPGRCRRHRARALHVQPPPEPAQARPAGERALGPGPP